MEGSRTLSLVVGAFVLLCLGVFAAVVFTLSSETGIFQERYRLVGYFENVQGLIDGAPVHLAGKEIGRVEEVAFGPFGGGRAPVRVDLLLDADVRDRIRSDSVARIGTIGLLGDKYVAVSMGTPEGRILEDGDVLDTATPPDLNQVAEQGVQALENITELTANANEVLGAFGERMGGAKAAEAVIAVSEMVEKVQRGEGLLHSLIYDRYEGSGVESIEGALASLEDILQQIRHGDGVLHTLIYDSPAEQDLVLQAVEAGARLNSILAKVDAGEGTLGLLLTDPTLYEDLKQLVGGARRSAVVRTLVRLSAEAED